MNKKKKKALSLILAIIMSTSGLSACSKNNESNVGALVSDKEFLSEYLDYYGSESVRYYNRLERLWSITGRDIKKAIKYSETIQECDFKYNNDYLNLFYKIINNTKAKVIGTGYEYLFSENDNYLDEEKQKEKEAFLSALNDVLQEWNNSTISDKNEDACLAQSLSFYFGFYGKDGELARYIPKDNKIILHLASIKDYANEKNINLKDCFMWVIKHEFNHMRQKPCSCKINKGQEFNFEKGSYSNIGSSLIESSAESAVYLEDGNISISEKAFPYVYSDPRYYESCLMLINLFQNDVDIDKYYKAIFNTNLQDLYSFFGAETDEEIYNFYELLFSIDILSSQKKFYSPDLVRLSYNVNYFNYILKEMVEYTYKNDNFTLQDNIVMFNLIKNVIAKLPDDKIYVYTSEKVKEMVNSIDESNSKYIEFLSKFYDESIENIKKLENNNYILMELMHYLNDPNAKYYDYSKNIQDLLEKFPDLKKIWFALGTIEYNCYDTLIQESGISYTK